MAERAQEPHRPKHRSHARREQVRPPPSRGRADRGREVVRGERVSLLHGDIGSRIHQRRERVRGGPHSDPLHCEQEGDGGSERVRECSGQRR